MTTLAGFHVFILVGASQVVPVVKNLPANAGDVRDVGSNPELGRSPVFLPGESYGQRNLAGYSPWGRKSQT